MVQRLRLGITTLRVLLRTTSTTIHVLYLYMDERPEIAGTKSTLAPALRKLTQRELRERHGHIGLHPDCTLLTYALGLPVNNDNQGHH